MTWTLDPSRHPHDHRSYYRREGRPFYGPRLRAVIEAEEPKPSIVYRLTEYYFTHRWPARAIVIAVCAAVGYFIGAAL